ncbi:MAG: PKD domain-containing protein [Acidobacteriota bacterium]
MTGPANWRRGVTYLLGVIACTAILFTSFSSQGRASLSKALKEGLGFQSPVFGSQAEPAPARTISTRSARAIAAEYRELAKDTELVRVAALNFNPFKDGNLPQSIPGLPAELLSGLGTPFIPPGMSADYGYMLVQYEQAGPVHEGLTKLGVEVLRAVPNKNYLVRVKDSDRNLLDSVEGVTWTGDFLPAYKVDVLSRDMLTGKRGFDVDHRGMLRFQVHFHADLDASPYETALKQVPGVELENLTQYREDPDVAHVLIAPHDLTEFLVQTARMHDVRSIDFVPVIRQHEDHAVWWGQTGITDLGASNYDETARLFALGIEGEGMIGAIQDDGLENDNCAFKYGNDVDEACWPIGPEPTSPMSPPEEEGELDSIRTRMRKTVSYLLFTGAAAYSTGDQHGTSTSGCMLGDVFGPTPNGALASRPYIRDLGTLQNILTCERTDGDWAVGDLLRNELASLVDDPTVNDPGMPVDYGTNVQHHQAQDGMAPGASLVFQDIGDAADNLVGGWQASAAYDQVDDIGATMHNASFGGDPCTGCYNQNAALADVALWRDRIFVGVSSAGNDGATGPQTIGAGIAHGKSVMTIGASVRSNSASGGSADRPGEDRANYSGIGPGSGGTLKPELLSPGSVIAHTGSMPAEDGSGSGNNDCGIPANVTGTSFASPNLGGYGLLVQQYFMDGWYPSGVANPADALRPTNALTRAVLVNSARNMRGLRTDSTGLGSAPRPNFGQGWGAPRLDDTLYFAGDPLRNDPQGDTERARLIVLTDTPNGLDTTDPMMLVAEPGGRTRDELVQSLRTAVTDGGYQTFALNVINPDPTDVANELRITMCYTDSPGGALDAPVVNDVDLEVISPSGVVYRPDPQTAWPGVGDPAEEQGYTRPSTDQTAQSTTPPFQDLDDRDALNTCENVFINPRDVEEGSWQFNVIGFDVPGGGGPDTATPNFIRNDLTPTIDTSIPCDGVNDIDQFDSISRLEQGYALIVSGNFTTTQGLVSLNRSSFGCGGDDLFITVTDENGDAMPDDIACPPRATIDVDLTTTTPSPGFSRDREIVTLSGTQPSYTNAVGLPVVIVADFRDVIHGDGIVQIAEGELITVTYKDVNPCGGESFAQASVSCRPTVSDQGSSISGGCDVVNPGAVGTSTVRPDQFLDADELVRYTVFFLNDGSSDLNDAIVSLEPDPTDPLMIARGDLAVDVLDSPQNVGLAPPGRRSDATFTVQMGPRCSNDVGPECLGPNFDGIPRRYQLNFNVCVSSPADGLNFPRCYQQTQNLESDIQAFTYNTTDPNGELYQLGGIERLVPGAADGSLNPEDYVEFDAMWYDPDADCGTGPGSCATICDVGRDAWPPPAVCLVAPVFRGNAFEPWDFNDDEDGFEAMAYSGDGNEVGPPTAAAQEWFWKGAPDGGGCGWEDELQDQLLTGAVFDSSHPDVFDQPWGIWHTGDINPVVGNTGPFPGAMPPAQGVPFFDDEDSPIHHTMYWDPPGPGDNSAGQWCETYLSDPIRFPNFYRSFLKPPRLFRVHGTNPEFQVEFDDLRVYTRLDGHTIDGNNLTVASWATENSPVDPVVMAGVSSLSWAQFQYLQLIFTDDTRPEWETEDSFIDDNLSALDENFPDRSYEDIYGQAADSWDMALSWAHLHFDGFTSQNQYGWGIDDVGFQWQETRDVDDETDCSLINGGGGQEAQVFFTESRYNACEGELDIVVVDTTTVGLPATMAVCVSSDAEDFEAAIVTQVTPTRWEGSIPFTGDPADDVLGTLLISPGQVDIGQGADDVRVEFDPFNASDHDPGSPAEEICDWMDADGDGINDDIAPMDGIPDAEDGSMNLFERERVDFSVINCTSGRVFYINHTLQDTGTGDGDQFADHGETVWMSVTLTSQLASDLRDVTVTLSTEDDTVCIIQDTVFLDTLPANNVLTQTPLDPGGAPGRQGFLFSVPAEVRTTDLADPRRVTFRIDVEGVNQGNLNEFSTLGTGFDSFQPMEAQLILDVDSRNTMADYNLSVNPGEFFEGFEGSSASFGFENIRIDAVRPGFGQPQFLDATTDTRYGAADNNGFCPECPSQTDCVVGVDCDHRFVPGEYDLTEPEWRFTDDWAYTGNQAFKFGDPEDDADENDFGQHYKRGQFASLELPPLRLACNDTITPELDFRHIANDWFPSFTSGLVTPIGSFVVEIAASPTGVDPGAPDTYREPTHAMPATIAAEFPTSNFRRLYAYQSPYDSATDALNACRTLYCGQHHHVYAGQGDPFNAPGSASDPRAGSDGHSTWENPIIDLSDYCGQEVVIRFTAQVMQDFEIQAGNVGWLIDDVTLRGVSNSLGLTTQALDNGETPCELIAAFESTSADCFGDEVTFFDRHSGLGQFRMDGTPEPIEYDYEFTGDAGTVTLGGPLAEDRVLTSPGSRGTAANPIIDPVAFGVVTMPGTFTATQRLYQGGALVAEFTDTVIYKDAPVPVFAVTGAGPFAGGSTLLSADVSWMMTPDPARDLVYRWNFDDGTAIDASGDVVSHVFAEPGDYDVELCVQDEDGCEGCVVNTITVGAQPLFFFEDVTVVDECAAPGSTGLGDGNGDYNEYVTITVNFRNDGTDATNVLGYLQSPDPAVEIVGGAAIFGDVPMGTISNPGEFTFIRRPDANDDPNCLVVPFELSLVSDSGAVAQEVTFAFPMGGAVDVMDATDPAPPAGVLCMGDTAPVVHTKPGVAGCLDGLTFSIDIQGIALATNGKLAAVRLRAPSSRDVTLYTGNGLDPEQDLSICFTFDSGVGLTDTCGTLNPATAETIVDDLTGEAMSGANPWQIEISTTVAGDCLTTGQWNISNPVLELRGKNPMNLDLGTEGTCEACLAPTVPIHQGVNENCVLGVGGVGAVNWSPAVDTSACPDSDDLVYELYVSTVEGELGMPATILDPGEDCSACDTMGGELCAFPRGNGASTWQVCGLEGVFYTVVVSDAADPATRVPNVSAPGDPVADEFQTESVVCAVPPEAPIIAVVKSPTVATDIEVWVDVPMGGGRPPVPARQGVNATSYHLFQGLLLDLHTGYTHESVGCNFVAPNTSLSSPTGSFYYLVPGVSNAGCVGMGRQGTRAGLGGPLEYVNGRPEGTNSCGGTCFP